MCGAGSCAVPAHVRWRACWPSRVCVCVVVAELETNEGELRSSSPSCSYDSSCQCCGCAKDPAWGANTPALTFQQTLTLPFQSTPLPGVDACLGDIVVRLLPTCAPLIRAQYNRPTTHHICRPTTHHILCPLARLHLRSRHPFTHLCPCPCCCLLWQGNVFQRIAASEASSSRIGYEYYASTRGTYMQWPGMYDCSTTYDPRCAPRKRDRTRDVQLGTCTRDVLVKLWSRPMFDPPR
jgi:hypothetical protein